jgi:hypothetical protein
MPHRSLDALQFYRQVIRISFLKILINMPICLCQYFTSNRVSRPRCPLMHALGVGQRASPCAMAYKVLGISLRLSSRRYFSSIHLLHSILSFMSDSNSNPPSCSTSPVNSESEISLRVSTQVTTYHITAAVASAGKKGKPKEKKETKTKEFMHKFHATLESYLSLLTSILSKHGQDKYKVSERRHFGIKILCSPSCAYVHHHKYLTLTTLLPS